MSEEESLLILKYACIQNRTDIIDFFIDHNIYLFGKSIDKSTGIHLLAQHQYSDNLLKVIQKMPFLINILDDENKSVLFYIVKQDNRVFEEINYPEINYDLISNNRTIIHELIDVTDTKKDIHFKRIKFILGKMNNINVPDQNPILCYAVEKEKIHVVELVLKQPHIYINCINEFHETPLLMSVMNQSIKISELLLYHGANMYRSGALNEMTLLEYFITTKNVEGIHLLLKYNYNIDYQNNKLQSGVHLICHYASDFSLKLLSFFIKNGNIQLFDQYRNTPIYYLATHKEKLSELFDLILERNFTYWNMKNIKDQSISDLLDKDQQKKILKTSSIQQIPFNELHIHTSSSFSPYLHFNFIYILIILCRNKELFVPFQMYCPEQYEYEMFMHDMVYELNESTMLKVHHENMSTLYEMDPSIILWKNKNQYYCNPNLDYYMKRCFDNKQIRFIMIKITVFNQDDGLHANSLIFDKQTGRCEHFEPYGFVYFQEYIDLDEYLKELFMNLTRIYCSEHNIQYSYYGPKFSNIRNGLQMLSSDHLLMYRKIGDPQGYCLAWSLWYIESRIKYPEWSYDEIVDQVISELIHTEYNGRNIFIDYIRNYSIELDKEKTKLLHEFDIPDEAINDIMFDDVNLQKYKIGLQMKFIKLVKQRLF
jgi:ankyrin repeat protein